LLEKEEELRIQKDLQNMDKLIQREQEKEKCIQTFLAREARKAKRQQTQVQAEQELSQIQGEVQQQVKNIKKVFRSKMGKLKHEAERIKMEKMRKLTDMKLRITSMLIDQESKGDLGNCKQDKEDAQIAYCNARFPTTWFESK